MISCTDYQNVHIHNFRIRWSFIWLFHCFICVFFVCVSLMSIKCLFLVYYQSKNMPCLILLARSMINRFNLIMQMNLFMMITHMVSSYLYKLVRNVKRTKPFRFKVYEKVKKKKKTKKIFQIKHILIRML